MASKSFEASITCASRGTWRELGVAVALSALIYGRHVADGPVSDDFLYLRWLDDGPLELLRHLTVSSDPQMMRPLGLVGWLLTLLPGGLGWLHTLTLGLHGIAGWQVSRTAALLGASRPAAWAAGAAFIVCPILSEPVVWASSHLDPLATVLALAATSAALATPVHPRRAALLLFVALSAKESVAAIPLAAVVLSGRRHSIRAGLAMMVPVALWGAARWAAFGGLGGYTGANGVRDPIAIDPVPLLATFGYQLPRALLALLKQSLTPNHAVVATLHFVLLAAVLRCLDLGPQGRGRIYRAVSAALLAALPAASVIGLDRDLQGSRLVYLSLALFAAGIAPALDLSKRGSAATISLLVVAWAVAAGINAGAWRTASRVVERCVGEVVARSKSLPPESVVFLDAPDSMAGAFAFRNGLNAAAERAGLRPGVALVLGQPSLLGQRRLLGRRAFAWAITSDGAVADRTQCARSLLVGNPRAIGSAPVLEGRALLPATARAVRVVLERVAQAPVAVAVSDGSAVPPVEGMVFPGRAATVVWLDSRPPMRPTIRIDVGGSSVASIEVLDLPPECPPLR